jgi:hypothetical protein
MGGGLANFLSRLVTNLDTPTSRLAGILGMSHHAQLFYFCFFKPFENVKPFLAHGL